MAPGNEAPETRAGQRGADGGEQAPERRRRRSMDRAEPPGRADAEDAEDIGRDEDSEDDADEDTG
ncbi:MAG TPA: hypothetical protein VNM90_03440, partial [Haliangium sp.]|nr:hypothetical protein [Haliangium sp.]